jgi:hypothetical protein
VTGDPAGSFGRIEAIGRVTRSDALRAARRFLAPESRTAVLVRAGTSSSTPSVTTVGEAPAGGEASASSGAAARGEPPAGGEASAGGDASAGGEASTPSNGGAS